MSTRAQRRFVVLFAGRERPYSLRDALQRLGARVDTYELLDGPEQDLSKPSVQSIPTFSLRSHSAATQKELSSRPVARMNAPVETAETTASPVQAGGHPMVRNLGELLYPSWAKRVTRFHNRMPPAGPWLGGGPVRRPAPRCRRAIGGALQRQAGYRRT